MNIQPPVKTEQLSPAPTPARSTSSTCIIVVLVLVGLLIAINAINSVLKGGGLFGSATATPQATYPQELAVRFTAYETDFMILNVGMQAMVADSTLLTDSAWKSRTSTQLIVLDRAATDLANVPGATSTYAHLDGLLDSLAAETHRFVANYGYAVDHADFDALGRATTNLQSMTAVMREVLPEVDRLAK